MNRKLYSYEGTHPSWKGDLFLTFAVNGKESGWWVNEDSGDTWEWFYNNTHEHSGQTLDLYDNQFTLIAPTALVEWGKK